MTTFSELIRAYMRSPEWAALKPNTRLAMEKAWGRCHHLDKRAINKITRNHVVTIKQQYASTPASANLTVAALSSLMSWAMDMGYIDYNPAKSIKKFPSGEWRRWQTSEVKLFLRKGQPHLARVCMVGVYTGQRQSDILRLRWSDFDGECLRFVQRKTGKALWVPCHSILKQLLRGMKGNDSEYILLNKNGSPWSAGGFRHALKGELRRLGLGHLQFHGLRKTAAAWLAEAGCTDREIMAITGHETNAMVSHYTKEAEQKQRALHAMEKLEAHA